MELTTLLRVAATVMSFLVFVGIIAWAWSGRRRSDFDEAAQLPFADDDRVDASTK